MRRNLLSLLFLFTILIGVSAKFGNGQDVKPIGLPMLLLTRTPDGILLDVVPHPNPISVPESGFAGLLSSEEIQREVQINKEQMIALERVFSELQDRIDSRFGLMSQDQLDQKMAEAIGEAAKEIVSEYATKTEEILLPFQIERLKQVFNTKALKSKSFFDIIRSPEIATRIELKSDQEAALLNKNKELQKDLDERLEALRKEYRNSLITDLTDLQKTELKLIFGEDFFETESNQPKSGQR